MPLHAHPVLATAAESSFVCCPLLPVPALERHHLTHAQDIDPGSHLIDENGRGYWVTAVLPNPRTGRIHLLGRSDAPHGLVDARCLTPPILAGVWGRTLRTQLHGSFEQVLAATPAGSSDQLLLHQQWLTNPACRSRSEPLRWHSRAHLPMVTIEDLISADQDSISSDGSRITTASPFHLGTLASPYLLYDDCGSYAARSPVRPMGKPSPFVFLPTSTTLAGHHYTWRDRTGTTPADPKVACVLLPVGDEEQLLLRRCDRDSLNQLRPAVGWAECSLRRPLRELSPLLDFLRAQAPDIGIMPTAVSDAAIGHLVRADASTLLALGKSEHPEAMRRFLSGRRSPASDHPIHSPIPYRLAVWAQEET